MELFVVSIQKPDYCRTQSESGKDISLLVTAAGPFDTIDDAAGFSKDEFFNFTRVPCTLTTDFTLKLCVHCHWLLHGGVVYYIHDKSRFAAILPICSIKSHRDYKQAIKFINAQRGEKREHD